MIKVNGLIAMIEKGLRGMLGVKKAQRGMMVSVLSTILSMRGKVNYKSLSREGGYHANSYGRWFEREFGYARFNMNCLKDAGLEGVVIGVMDTSFIKKSGKETEGIGNFWNSKAGKAEKGLEISCVALVYEKVRSSFVVSCQQTMDKKGEKEESRMQGYVAQWEGCVGLLPEELKYLVVDAYYAKRSFVDGVLNSKQRRVEVIGKLRQDANLKYFAQEQETQSKRGRGRPKRYDGKVYFSDLSRFDDEGVTKEGFKVYSKVLWHVQFKRALKVVVILKPIKAGYTHAVLFSTDTSLAALELITLYQLRFQIEFLFRDAKQFTDLTSCQARNASALHSHFNASLTSVNLAKLHLI